jgi:hypothetical protein
MTVTRTRTIVAVALAWSVSACGASSFTQSETREPITIEQYDTWMEELSNWGRWGEDDELGAANLMTEAKRREAAALVREGTTVSLAHDMLTEEAADVTEPYVLQMTVNGENQNSKDRIDVSYHGVSTSHLDGLCHVFYKDKVYNGLDYREVATDDGCTRMDTTAMKHGLVTRAVLIDMPRLKGGALSRARHEALSGGHRGVGGVRRCDIGFGRRTLAPHRPLGPPSGHGSHTRDVGLGRIGHAVSGRA